MRKTIGAALAAGVLAFSADATVLYSQSGRSPYGGNNPEALGNFVAQDFALSSAASLGSFTFNAYTNASTVPLTDLNLNIYVNNGSSPGALIYSGDFKSITSAVTGHDDGYTQMDYTVSLPNWQLNAGSYFLALNVKPNQTNVHWSIASTSPLPGNDFISSSGTPGTFSSYSFEHIFRLESGSAVPEPASWAMMISGFGLVGAALRRKKTNVSFA